MGPQTEGPRYRVGAVVTALLAGMMLCAAGQTAGATADRSRANARPATLGALCSSVSNMDRLVVTRTDSIPQDHFDFTFPSLVTVRNARVVRAAARALCALPKMPKSGLHCPADWGITYHLAFAAKGHDFPSVDVDATGCQGVRGLGQLRWVARSPEFWKVLGTAMGLAKPDASTFAGSRVDG